MLTIKIDENNVKINANKTDTPAILVAESIVAIISIEAWIENTFGKKTKKLFDTLKDEAIDMKYATNDDDERADTWD